MGLHHIASKQHYIRNTIKVRLRLCTRQRVLNTVQNLGTRHSPPIECDLGYRFWTRTLYRNPNNNLNPNPKTDPNPNPNPKSNSNVCSAKRHK